jgi:hypothetical protein
MSSWSLKYQNTAKSKAAAKMLKAKGDHGPYLS